MCERSHAPWDALYSPRAWLMAASKKTLNAKVFSRINGLRRLAWFQRDEEFRVSNPQIGVVSGHLKVLRIKKTPRFPSMLSSSKKI